VSTNGNHSEPEKTTDTGGYKSNRWHRARALRHWAAGSLRDNVPHYLIALFTLFLVVFAWYAWDESTRGTAALQEQVLVLKADQRPMIWVTDLDPAPTYLDASGQVLWGWRFQNIGKSIAYNVVMNQYIKIGSERYQRGRNRGANAIELEGTKPIDIPPGQRGPFATVASRAGVNKDFITQLMAVDHAFGILVEFTYTDASGKTRYTNAVCLERLATGANAITPPADCQK